MLFSPESDLLWDTWLVEHEGSFQLYYLRTRPAHERASRPGPAATIGFGWDAVNLATSEDLIHWTDHGPVLHKSPDALWMGTGMVHRVGERFIMNFSEERPRGHQVVSFATSGDLVEWQRLPREFDLRSDGVIYQNDPACSADPLPRWESIGVVSPSDGRDAFSGFITADAVRTPRPGLCGVLGRVDSVDGLHWTVGKPLTRPGLFPSFEVAQHVQFDSRHYALFSTNTTAGARFVPGDPAPQGGTYYVVADAVDGPYDLPPAHPLLQGHRIAGREFGTYVGRPFRASSGELLYYHHWTANIPDGSWGPPKVLVERAPFVLGLDYWPGTERVKLADAGCALRPADLAPLPQAGALPVVEWKASESRLEVADRGGAHAMQWHADNAGRDGHVIEAEVTIASGRALGFWFGYADRDHMLGVSLDADAGCVEFGSVSWFKDGSSVGFAPDEEGVPWDLVHGRPTQARVLARRQFVELYLDDHLVKSFVAAFPLDPARLGFYAERADGSFANVRHWPMSV